MRGLICVSMIMTLALTQRASACGIYFVQWRMDLNEAMSNEDPKAAQAAIQSLRAGGQKTLDQLLAERDHWKRAYSPEWRKIANAEQIQDVERRMAKLDEVIDQVGGQRYCTTSRLFWHTDFEKAKEAAKASGKPILSLRMLGNLTDEYSCANSRFFRTTLYANEQVSKKLRENFILHWKSVRPVPKITVDFGDGRKLERTLTGNSIHYVVTADGRPIDGLPGLYGPKAFSGWLDQAAQTAKTYEGKPAGERDAFLTKYHADREIALAQAWANDIRRISPAVYSTIAAKVALNTAAENSTTVDAPHARKAARLAVTKSEIELPLIPAVTVSANADVLAASTDAELWSKIAALHAEDAKLDNASVALIRSENPTATAAGALAEGKRRVEDPVLRVIRTFESSIALDAVQNEYLRHRTIHQWFAQGIAPTELDALNEDVYAKVFLTPRNDPWLGLVPADTYSALKDDGVVSARP